jgi:hypothetical protein
MHPTARLALLLTGLLFCAIFGAMTAYMAVEHGFDIFILAAILVLLLLVLPLIGALLHPPEDE